MIFDVFINIYQHYFKHINQPTIIAHPRHTAAKPWHRTTTVPMVAMVECPDRCNLPALDAVWMQFG